MISFICGIQKKKKSSSDIQETNCWLPEARGREKWGFAINVYEVKFQKFAM